MAQSTDSEYGGDEKGHEMRHKMGQAKIARIRGSWKLMGGPGVVGIVKIFSEVLGGFIGGLKDMRRKC